MNHHRSYRAHTTTIVGCMFIAFGFIAGVLYVVAHHGDLVRLLGLTAVNALVMGTLFILYAQARGRGRSIEEAYSLGYDLGYEQGHRDGVAADYETERRAAPTADGSVVELRPRKP